MTRFQRDHARAQLGRPCGNQLGAKALAARRASHAEAGTSAAGDSQPLPVSPPEQGAATGAAPSANHVDIVVLGLPLPLGFGPEEAAAGLREFCKSSLGLSSPRVLRPPDGDLPVCSWVDSQQQCPPWHGRGGEDGGGRCRLHLCSQTPVPRSCLVSINFDQPRKLRRQRQQHRQLGGRALAARPRPPQPPAAAAPPGQTA